MALNSGLKRKLKRIWDLRMSPGLEAPKKLFV